MSEFDFVMLLMLIASISMGIWVFMTTKEKELYLWAIGFAVIPILYFFF